MGTTRIEPDMDGGRIDLPEELLAQLGIEIGDEVEVNVRDGCVVITPLVA